MAGIPTSNILKPGGVALQANQLFVSQLQLLTPQYKKEYVLKYGAENFHVWLSTYAGMEEVKNREFFWFENRGKLQLAITNRFAIVGPAAGATVTVQLSVEDHYNNGTQTPARVGETVRVASSNIEGEIVEIVDQTPNAFQVNIRPKKSTEAFISANSNDLLADEVILFGGYMDAGEGSSEIVAQQHLDEKYTNTITEMREEWSATDLAGMTEIFYNSGIGGDSIGSMQGGYSYFTYKELTMSERRWMNSIDLKFMRGDKVTNTGLIGDNTEGTQGIISKVLQDGEVVTYTPGNLDIAKLQEIVRIADVNGAAKQCLWLMDSYQRQDFDNGIFAEFPAGAYVWGKNEQSEEAAVTFGTKTMDIGGYRFQAKKYLNFTDEAIYGKTPANSYFRDFGMLCPLGESEKYQAKDENKTSIKNITIMYQQPSGKGGFVGNGIRSWAYGGGSANPSNGTLTDNVSMVTYRAPRIAAANQFIILQKA